MAPPGTGVQQNQAPQYRSDRVLDRNRQAAAGRPESFQKGRDNQHQHNAVKHRHHFATGLSQGIEATGLPRVDNGITKSQPRSTTEYDRF
jgi:hypothetical protein